MDTIINLLLFIVNNNGEIIFKETHDIFLGPEGLLRVPERLGFRVEDLVCFPTKQKAQDSSNMGVPFLRCSLHSTKSVVLVALSRFQVLATCIVLREFWKYLQGVSASRYLRILQLPFPGPVVRSQLSRYFGNTLARMLRTTLKTCAINVAPVCKR